jgi:hypothetical protein
MLSRASHICLSDDTRQVVRELLRAGLQPDGVISFILARTGEIVSRLDLMDLVEPGLEQALGTETDTLIEHMMAADANGQFDIFLVDGANESLRAAVATFTEEEMKNLERFGDVVFLDGTSIRNRLGWTCYPITLIGDRKELVSGGLLFAAYEREEMFTWFLHILMGRLNGKLQTLFTDEDSALMLAISLFQEEFPEVAHRISIWHKRRNVLRHVSALCQPSVRDRIMTLFDQCCYSHSQTEVINAIDLMTTLAPNFIPYIDREIRPQLALFTEAYRGNAFTLGYHSTSPAESVNKLLKKWLPPRVQSLVDIRVQFTKAFAVKTAATDRAIAHEFRWGHFLQTDFGVRLQKPIARRIDELVEMAKLWKTRQIGHNVFEATTERGSRWQLEHSEVESEERPVKFVCQCNENSATGLPCSHLIALFRDHGLVQPSFPIQSIAPRWIPNFEGFNIRDVEGLTIGEHDQYLKSAHEELLKSDDDSAQGWENGTDEGFPDDGADLPTGPTVETPLSKGDRQNYNKILFIGKQIAGKISRNGSQFTRVYSEMNQVLSSLMNEQDGEMRDAAGVGPGRTPKHGNSEPEKDRVVCILCGKAHTFRRCRWHFLLEEESAAYGGAKDGKRHCSICRCSDHTAAQCPVIEPARQRVERARQGQEEP